MGIVSEYLLNPLIVNVVHFTILLNAIFNYYLCLKKQESILGWIGYRENP